MVRLDGPTGFHIARATGDPVGADGWEAPQLVLMQGLLPHIRQFVRVRQALVSAGALGLSVTDLLDNPRIGVIQLDQRGRIVEANDRAWYILRHGAGLSDRNGELRVYAPAPRRSLRSSWRVRFPSPGRSRQWVHDAPAGTRLAPIRGARQTRTGFSDGLRRPARSRAGAERRTGEAMTDRSGLGG